MAKRTPIGERISNTAKGLAAFDLNPIPANDSKTEQQNDGKPVKTVSSPTPATNFKLTLYVNKGMVEDFDEAWARIKRGSNKRISRSAAFEAAIRVALKNETDIRDQLGLE